MKRLLITASIIAFAFFPFLASAQGISQLQQWKTAGANYLQPLSNAYGLLVPGLATSSTGCLTIASNGWISATGSLCGSGSGGSGFATTSADYWLTTKTTSNVTEGSNLYFTNARSDVRFITDLAGTTSVKSIATLPSLSLPYSQLTGTPIIASSTLLSDSNTFSGVDLFTNSSSNFAGTWQTFSPSHFQTALSLTADSLVYTDHSGILTTVASSSLDLPNGALQNSSITVNSTTFNLGDSKTITAASSTLFSDFDTFAHTITGSVSGSAGSVANAITFNNSGSGASSGSTFNGSGALTVSYNTIGAQVAGTYATFGYPFTTATDFNQIVVASTTASKPIWFENGLYASTTLIANNATTTNATTTSLGVSNVVSALLLTNASGSVGKYGGTSCTNQFPRSLSALGAATCATVAN